MNKQQSTKNKILNASKNLFYENGFDATSIRQIAEASEMTKSNIFYYFDNKEEILNKLLEKYILELSDEIIINNPNLSDLELLLAYTYAQIYYQYTDPKFKRLCLEAGDTLAEIIYDGFVKVLFPKVNPDSVDKENFVNISLLIVSQNELFKIKDAHKIDLGYDDLLIWNTKLIAFYLNTNLSVLLERKTKIQSIVEKIEFDKLNFLKRAEWIEFDKI